MRRGEAFSKDLFHLRGASEHLTHLSAAYHFCTPIWACGSRLKAVRNSGWYSQRQLWTSKSTTIAVRCIDSQAIHESITPLAEMRCCMRGRCDKLTFKLPALRFVQDDDKEQILKAMEGIQSRIRSPEFWELARITDIISEVQAAQMQ